MRDQLSKEFNKVKQFIKDFNIKDYNVLNQEIINIMNKNSIDIKLNKLKIQLNKIEKIVELFHTNFAININEELQKN